MILLQFQTCLHVEPFGYAQSLSRACRRNKPRRTMESVYTERSTHDQRPWASLACLGLCFSTIASLPFVSSGFLPSILLPPLRSIPITRLLRYYEGSDFHTPHHLGVCISLIPALNLPVIPPPTTPYPPPSLLQVTPQLGGLPCSVQGLGLAIP